MIRIAITGPESCGKTSLAEDLAQHYKTDFIPEFAREYLTKAKGKYQFDDLEIMAKGQLESIKNFSREPILIADTEMLVLNIWSQVVFGKTAPFVKEALDAQKFDLYILCDTDVPWTYDPLRENEFDRDDLFRLYYKKMRDLKLNMIMVRGSRDHRLKAATEVIDKLLTSQGS